MAIHNGRTCSNSAVFMGKCSLFVINLFIPLKQLPGKTKESSKKMLISSWYGATHLRTLSQPFCHSSTKHVKWLVVWTVINLHCSRNGDIKFHGTMGLAANFMVLWGWQPISVQELQYEHCKEYSTWPAGPHAWCSNVWPVKVKISCLTNWNRSSLDWYSLLLLYRQMNTIFVCTRTYALEIWSLRMTKMSKCVTFTMNVSLTQYKWQSTELKCRVCSHKQKFFHPDVLLWENICKVSNFLGCDAVFLGE